MIRILRESATLFALFSGLLYLIGTTFNQGFNLTFHLDNQVMSKDFHLIILDGFTTLLALTLFEILVICAVIVVTLIFYAFLISFFPLKKLRLLSNFITRYNRRTKRQYTKQESRQDQLIRENKFKKPFINAVYTLLLSAFICFVITLVFVKVLEAGHDHGIAQAKIAKEVLNDSLKHKSKLIFFEPHEKITPKTMLFIKCGSYRCAAINNQNKIQYFNIDTRYSFFLPEKTIVNPETIKSLETESIKSGQIKGTIRSINKTEK